LYSLLFYKAIMILGR